MISIKQAVILAGGLGTRMRPLTNNTPKVMIPIHDKPFLAYLIELLKKNGIEEVIILVGYLHEQIEKYFGTGEKYGLKITYSYDPVEADTGTRLRNASRLFAKHFLLLYGDNYWPLQLEILISFYNKIGVKNLVTVYSNFDNATKSNILVGNDGLVKIYDKTRTEKNLNGVDIGFFILDKSIFIRLPKKNFSFEKVIIPRLIKEKQMSGYLTNHKYYGLSNPGRIPMIEEYFKKKKIVFLDRDGVINKRPPKAEYITSWEKFEFLPGAIEALKLLTKKGYEIIIISNQAGIGRGAMTEEDLKKIHKKFLEVCKTEGIKIKAIYYCPHNWDEGCFCRKPKPGMLFKAAADHSFDLTKALFIGDDERDKQAGKAANCRTILLQHSQNLTRILGTIAIH